MGITKVTRHRQLRRSWPRRWNLWCLVWLIIGFASIAWAQVPPPGPPLFGAQVEGVPATMDTTLDFTLDSGSILSGKVRDTNGMEVILATVLAQSDTEIFSSSLVVELDPVNPIPEFKYRIVLPDGTYDIFVRMTVLDTAAMLPQLLSVITFDLQETVVVDGDTERDFMVPAPPPFFNLTGQVVSLGTLPSEGSLFFQSEDGRVSNFAQAEMADGATTGTYSTTLPAGTYDVSYTVTLPETPEPDPGNPTPPPPDPEVPQQSVSIPVGTVTLSADQVFDINVPATVSLSGKLRDSMGMALAGATIFAASGLPPATPPPPGPTRALCQSGVLAAFPPVASSTASLPQNNTMGNYELLVVPGDYQVGVTTPVGLNPPATVPTGTLQPQRGLLTFPFPSEMMTITENQTRDFILPLLPEAVLVSGRVMDQQNQPVSNANVNAVSSMVTATPNVLFSNNVETNEMGDYQLLVLSGVDYTVTVCPPRSASPVDILTP